MERNNLGIPYEIFIPIRGIQTTDHSTANPQVITSISVADGELNIAENYLITLTGKKDDNTKSVSFSIPVLLTRINADTPNAYKAETGSISAMTSQESDFFVELVANGDVGANLEVTHDIGSAGNWEWVFQIWKMDELLLT